MKLINLITEYIHKINEDNYKYRGIRFYKGWLRNGGRQYIVMITDDLKNKFPSFNFGLNGASGKGKTKKQVKNWIDNLYKKNK